MAGDLDQGRCRSRPAAACWSSFERCMLTYAVLSSGAKKKPVGSDCLTFLSLTTSGGFNGQQWFGPALDNVRVSAVPLPGALALFAPAVLGFLGMGWFRRQ